MMPVFCGRSIDPGTFGFAVPFRRYVEAAAAAGFDTVEVPVGALHQIGVKRIRALLAEHGIAAPIYSCPWSLPANGSVPDDIFASRLAMLPALLDQVAAAGGRLISAFFASHRPGMTALPHDALTDRCGTIREQASAAGLDFCVELNDVEVLRDAIRVLGDVDRLLLLFDSFHFFRAGLTPEWFATIPHGRIGWVHLSGVPRGAVATLDGGPRCPPHAGQQDLASIVRGLSATGYAGPLSLEIIPAPPDGIDLVRYGRELLNATLTALTAASVDWRRSGPRTQISGQA